jgi:hypothetical protein
MYVRAGAEAEVEVVVVAVSAVLPGAGAGVAVVVPVLLDGAEDSRITGCSPATARNISQKRLNNAAIW